MGLINAVVLYVLVSVFSSGTESSARWKILLIALGTGLLQAVLVRLVPGLGGALTAMLVSFGLIIVALIYWCAVERKPALKIASTYLGICLAIGVLAAFFV